MKAIMLTNKGKKILIPIPNVKVDDTDVKIIKNIMNTDGFDVEEKLSVVNSFLRYLKRKQGK